MASSYKSIAAKIGDVASMDIVLRELGQRGPVHRQTLVVMGEQRGVPIDAVMRRVAVGPGGLCMRVEEAEIMNAAATGGCMASLCRDARVFMRAHGARLRSNVIKVSPDGVIYQHTPLCATDAVSLLRAIAGRDTGVDVYAAAGEYAAAWEDLVGLRRDGHIEVVGTRAWAAPVT